MSEGQSPTQPLPQSQGGGGGDPTRGAPALDHDAPARTHPLDRGGVVPDEPTTPAAPPAVESCELSPPEGLASHSHGSTERATMGPVGGGVPSPNVTSARNTDRAPTPERNTERARLTGPQNEAGQDRTTTEPDDGQAPPPDVSREPNQGDPGPEGGTSRNTDRVDLMEHTYTGHCPRPWCGETYQWTGSAPEHAGLDVIWPQVAQALKDAGWRVIPSIDGTERPEAECPEHNPYGREFKEAVRAVIREDLIESNQRAIQRELERPLLLGEPWYGSPDPVKRGQEYDAAVAAAKEPDDDHTSDGRCKYPATCILENRHPVDSAQEPPANVPPDLVGPICASISFPAPGGGRTVIAPDGIHHEPDGEPPTPPANVPSDPVLGGSIRIPTQQTIEAIAKAFDVPVELLGKPGAYENAEEDRARRQAWAEDLARKATAELTDWCPVCGRLHKIDAACSATGTMNLGGLLGSDHSGITPHYVTGDTNQNERPRRSWWRRLLRRPWPWCDICQERAPRGHK